MGEKVPVLGEGREPLATECDGRSVAPLSWPYGRRGESNWALSVLPQEGAGTLDHLRMLPPKECFLNYGWTPEAGCKQVSQIHCDLL